MSIVRAAYSPSPRPADTAPEVLGMPSGWQQMSADDVLAFHTATLGLNNRGFVPFQSGTEWSEDKREPVVVYGVERNELMLNGQLVATSLVAVQFAGNAKALERLAVRAAAVEMPFDADGEQAFAGVEAPDFEPDSRNTPAKALHLAITAEDDMARFIAGARAAGLLRGVAILVRDFRQDR